MIFQNWRYALEFAPIWAIDKMLGVLPRPVCLKIGESLGALAARLLPQRNTLVRENLAAVFPEKSVAERENIRRGVWRNVGRVAAEFVRLGDIRRALSAGTVEIEGKSVLEKAVRQNKGVILVGFHFTNWEATGVGGDVAHGNIIAVARPIKNPFVDQWVREKRGRGGMNIILHRQAVRGALKALKEKKAVGILVDQNLYTGGVFADFLGRPAATTPLPALLHSRTGAPMLLLYALRSGDKFRIIFEDLSFSEADRGGLDSLQSITAAINRRLGELIRAHPENWFWVHNRWKRKPE